jgi:hypothetical protein
VPWQEQAAVRRDLEELQHVTNTAVSRALAQVGATGCPQGSGGNGLPPVGAADCPEVGAMGCREELSRRKGHRNTPRPPIAAQQQGKGREAQDQRGSAPPAASTTGDASAQALMAGFYRGLGMPVDAATPAIRRRELVIAHQLVAAGATPAEAESYAREARAAAGRIAPIDLRSYERERLSWLARRAAPPGSERRLVDRTGQGPHGRQPASLPQRATTGGWGSPRPGADSTAGQRRSADLGTVARSLFGQRP